MNCALLQVDEVQYQKKIEILTSGLTYPRDCPDMTLAVGWALNNMKYNQSMALVRYPIGAQTQRNLFDEILDL